MDKTPKPSKRFLQLIMLRDVLRNVEHKALLGGVWIDRVPDQDGKRVKLGCALGTANMRLGKDAVNRHGWDCVGDVEDFNDTVVIPQKLPRCLAKQHIEAWGVLRKRYDMVMEYIEREIEKEAQTLCVTHLK